LWIGGRIDFGWGATSQSAEKLDSRQLRVGHGFAVFAEKLDSRQSWVGHSFSRAAKGSEDKGFSP
jgi:hypothetical protein